MSEIRGFFALLRMTRVFGGVGSVEEGQQPQQSKSRFPSGMTTKGMPTEKYARGAWYSFQGERIGQGRENVRNFLKETGMLALMGVELRKKMDIAPSTMAVIPGSAGGWSGSGRGCGARG